MVAFKKILVIAALAATATLSTAVGTQIGVDQPHNLEVQPGQSRQEVISYPRASYVAVHFSQFNLPEGDVVVVRSPDSKASYEYTGLGRADLGKSEGGFYASLVPGNTAVVEYRSLATDAGNSTDYGFKVDKFARGFATKQESICGNDDTLPAKCFKDTKPIKYAKAQSVARLFIGGKFFCTGWLVGSEGHMLTNHHCITKASDAATVDIEFNAESSSCDDKCDEQLGCRGTIVATQAQFIQNNQDNDWALIKLPRTANVSPYGYLQMRGSGPVVNEEIYILQHPGGWAKRIVDVVDGGSPAVIKSLTATNTCGAGSEVAYQADTQGGSSGSPVLGASDNTVVALHHCGGCDNGAINIQKVIGDLSQNGITIKDGIVGNVVKPTPAPYCSRFKTQRPCDNDDSCIWDVVKKTCVAYNP